MQVTKSTILKARLEPSDMAFAQEAARKMGLSVSAWARAVLLERLEELKAKRVIG